MRSLCTSLLSRQVRDRVGKPNNPEPESRDRDASEPDVGTKGGGEAVSYAVARDDAAADVAFAGPLQHCDSPLGVSGCFCTPIVAKSDSKTLGGSPRNVFAAARVGRHRGVGARCG